MNINEFEQKLDYLANNFNALFTDVIQLRINTDFVGAIKNRVITKAEKADGGQFSAYSPNTAKFKGSQGKTGAKNFFDTGQMWKSFKTQQRTETKDGTMFTLKMGNEKRVQEVKGKKGATPKSNFITNQEIAEKHSEIEGISIIDPSEKEIAVVTVMAKKEALKIIKETLT